MRGHQSNEIQTTSNIFPTPWIVSDTSLRMNHWIDVFLGNTGLGVVSDLRLQTRQTQWFGANTSSGSIMDVVTSNFPQKAKRRPEESQLLEFPGFWSLIISLNTSSDLKFIWAKNLRKKLPASWIRRRLLLTYSLIWSIRFVSPRWSCQTSVISKTCCDMWMFKPWKCPCDKSRAQVFPHLNSHPDILRCPAVEWCKSKFPWWNQSHLTSTVGLVVSKYPMIHDYQCNI